MGSHRYEWVLEADIEACFDSISHTALLARVRARVKDKRVLNLVKAFLKAGILTELGGYQDTYTGTPQGGILSPLLANIALSVLDEYFQGQWRQQMRLAHADQVVATVNCRADAEVVFIQRGTRRAVRFKVTGEMTVKVATKAATLIPPKKRHSTTRA